MASKNKRRRPLVVINYELYRRKINPRLISFYHYLAHQMINRKHEVRIDRASVADDIGVSVPTLMKYLRLLVKEGFLITDVTHSVISADVSRLVVLLLSTV